MRLTTSPVVRRTQNTASRSDRCTLLSERQYWRAVRVGLAGKGGVGKTTISAVLSRSLARRGHRVIAVDCDSNPDLAAGSGVPPEEVARLRPFLDQRGGGRSTPSGLGPVELLERYGHPGPDGVTLLLGARAERAGAG